MRAARFVVVCSVLSVVAPVPVSRAERASADADVLVVLAEPGMALGDCRIEWADGGLCRDRAATEAVICEAVERYVAARREASAP